MTSYHTPGSALAVLSLFLISATWVAPAQAAKKITCSQDDVRYEINVDTLAIKYQAAGLEATLSGLGVLGAQMAVAPKTLQQAAVATQKLNEFVKALATGYNSCAISKKAYEEGIKSLLPAMQSDGKVLEALRQQFLADQKVDANHLKKILANYNNKLERLARISGKGIDYERIGIIVDEQLAKHTQTILAGQKTETELILTRLGQLELGMRETPPPTPQQVKTEISAIKQQLQVKADEAEAAYSQGFELLERYRFTEAIPFLEKALAAVKLPDFYLVLGLAYHEYGDLAHAEHILREGLAQVDEAAAPEAAAKLSNTLGLVFQAKGDLDGALAYTQRALKIDEKVFGPEHPNVARDANNIGHILQAKGDLDGAFAYTQQALKIFTMTYGLDNPLTKKAAINLEEIRSQLKK